MKAPITFLTLAAGPLSLLAADVTGTWKSEFDSQIGNQKYTYTFKQDGTNLTGEANSEINGQKHEAELKEGRVNDDTVSFVEMLNFQDNDIRITYRGTILTNEIKFTREVGDFAKEEIVARREPAAATASVATNSTARRGQGAFGFGRPALLPAGVKAERNIRYVENGTPKQVLDLFLPEQPSEKPLPLMIWIHGGAWMAGDQASPPVLYLVNKGFAVASIQYRFSQDAVWPAQAYDCKAAIRFLRANAPKYNLDPDHFGVGGDSSGGHLAAFIGTSGDVKEMEGDLGNTNVSSRVQAVVDWFGPTDVTLMGQQAGPHSMIQHDGSNSPEARLLGGPMQEKRDLAKTANPLTYIDKSDPPFLIMHGDNDQLVPLGQSVILAKALIDAGVEVTMKTLHGAGHEGPEFRTPESQRLVEEFLSRKLKVDK
jgi:acetyl esterase/lipase